MILRGKTSRTGRERERQVIELLRASGFRAHPNARAAKPRQTDIVADGHHLHLLVEVKDRKRPVDVGDIDSLRARLGRITPDVIRVIFTTGAIGRGAIRAIESDRTREVLAFDAAEIELLRGGRARLLNLISRKRHELRVNGRAWFRRGLTGDYADMALPRSTIQFVSESTAGGYFCSGTAFVHSAFALDIPDTGWSNAGGEGVRLQLSLSLDTPDDLRDLFGYLHSSFGLSANGAFTIQQSQACWHGAGVRNFIAAVTECSQRYEVAALERVHHSEDLIYFDQLRNGWVSLHARQRVPDFDAEHSAAYLHDTRLNIQLSGMPVDLAPYVDLCRYTGNEWAEFQAISARRTHTLRLKKRIRLMVLGTAVQTYDDRGQDRWIIGLIARNPFYGRKSLPRELEFEEGSLHDLLGMELLLCKVREHLEYGDVVDEYLLEGIETTDTADAQIIRPFGTWNNIVKRVRGASSTRRDARRPMNGAE